ncbi:Protein EPIDERMAL PATTERNING FACTOR 1 [Stylosanthes scabra]|uniref:Epidermal patterning factor-like protein n=1 Tax=Stylosanthes scabra TaxID=79078 RepID=A0ABU6U1G9_9FABA|nr:Protein EPIDERMAL PATTERNING FACTOR 1 [Stylosanthes scabra]
MTMTMMMTRTHFYAAAFFLLLMLMPYNTPPISARHLTPSNLRGHDENPVAPALPGRGGKGADTLQVAGSRLPDCSRACGPCSPCRLVMVSFVCSSLQEAETCPMAYKCMCHNKSYPVP